MNKVIAGVAAAGALAISLSAAGPAFAENNGKGNDNGKGNGHTAITICHKTGNGFKFMDTPDDNSLQAHLGHGDYLASSPADCPAGPSKGLDPDVPGIVPPPHAEPNPVAPVVPAKPPVKAVPAPAKESYPAPAVKPNVPANGIPAAPLADPEASPVVDEELAYTGAAEDALFFWGAAGIGALVLGTGAVVYARRKS